ncbi:LysR family transcriptional regulator [Marinomonas piezotolerans]|uniref:LysR family transcriptional regulator n=1 Tax=Marinomonas piezotolerans TaxID=2213058 RepID=A0A370UBS6_9GAMM|nr:LysR family transcriptional regulator [Marinomonas piezotolerans]RDL45263.1 LysR family transcriptional regulator [Marinomonas piezotolerans]
MTISYEQLDWNALKAFVTAAQSGSFSKAAKRIGVTQPTLSRQIYSLEQSLNVTLFERLSTGLQLTTAGQQLLASAGPMTGAAQQVSLTVSGLAESLEGEVSLSVSEIDALFRVPDLVRYLRMHAPTIHLTIHVDNQVSDIKRRDTDIALRSFRPSEPDLIAKRLIDEPIWFYGTHELAARFKDVATPSEATNLQIIGFERNDELINRLKPLGWHLDQSHFAIVTSFQGLQWQLVKKGLGLGFFPQAIGDQETSLARAFEQFGPPVIVPLWLVTHRELHTSPKIRLIFDLIVAWFEQQNVNTEEAL